MHHWGKGIKYLNSHISTLKPYRICDSVAINVYVYNSCIDEFDLQFLFARLPTELFLDIIKSLLLDTLDDVHQLGLVYLDIWSSPTITDTSSTSFDQLTCYAYDRVFGYNFSHFLGSS